MLLLFLFIHLVNIGIDDVLLTWFVQHDPDASIIHFHMVRSILITVGMFLIHTIQRKRLRYHQTFGWLIKWTLLGFVLPHITYTWAIQHVRIDILQPLIPFLAHPSNTKQRVALILFFSCSLVTVSQLTFTQPIIFVVTGYIASGIHVLSLSTWYKMLENRDMFTEMCIGQLLATAIFSFIWLDESTSSLNIFQTPIYEWFTYLLLSCIIVVLRYTMINQFRGNTIITVFECLHPIITHTTHTPQSIGIFIGSFIFLYKDDSTVIRCIQERYGVLPCWRLISSH